MSFDKDFVPDPKHFTKNAYSSIIHAAQLTRDMDDQYLGTEHLLLGILKIDKSTGASLLKTVGVHFERTRLAVATPAKTRSDSKRGRTHQYTETAKQTINNGLSCAREYNQELCGTEHLLFSMLLQGQSRATKLLQDMNVDTEELSQILENNLHRSGLGEVDQDSGYESFYSDVLRRSTDYEQRMPLPRYKLKQKGGNILDVFGVDFTALARKNKLDPVVGRQVQIQRMVTILNRRTKNNPVLIGEPGVGKTAIVEGLVQKIVKNDVPAPMLNKRVISLDLTAMVAGTKYRGEFEERLKLLMKELSKSKDIILFIDEIHLLIGAGSSEGAMDAGNILKPALARGQIQVIGATTTADYTKYIEKDAALERRFQTIMVPETTVPETRQVLKGVRQRYADFHQVQISDEIIDKTVALADRYINDRYLPDKAIDLLDEAAAHLRITSSKTKAASRTKENEIQSLKLKMRLAGETENYELAADLKKRLESLQQADVAKSQTQTMTVVEPALELESKHLAHVISVWTGVPVQQVLKAEAKFLLNLEKRLKKRVIGQNEAIEVVARAIRRNRSGINDPKRPIGSFLFLGSTGVGKTELARVLATEFYGRLDNLIKLDMSEFAERHTVSKLIGAPPGYVGYEQPGQLTDKVRRKPYSLVLFDEIEKAHPDVFSLLLQILEDGCLTDSKGRRVDFANTIIILTSNIGSSAIQKDFNLGFGSENSDEQQLQATKEQNQHKIQKALKDFMRPELLNRLDKVLIFNNLSKANVLQIVKVRLEELKQRLTDKKLGLVVSFKARNYLAKAGYDQKNGMRPLRRLIQTEIEDLIAEGLLEDKFKVGDMIRIDLDSNNKIIAQTIVE